MMRLSIPVLAMVLAAAAVFLAADIVAAGGQIIITPPSSTYERTYENQYNQDDEYYAKKMWNWMRLRRREPKDNDFRSNPQLRYWWGALGRVKAEAQRKKREREADRKRYRERKGEQLEKKARREYRKGLNQFADRKYRDAIQQFQKVMKNRDYASYHQDARTKLQEMDQVGRDGISQAKLLAADEDYEKACARYRSVMQRFRGLPCARAAGKEYAALKNDPQVIAALKKDRAVNISQRADKAYAAGDYATAVSLYEMLVKGYSDVSEGLIAKTKLAQIKDDEAVWAAVLKQRAEAEATSLLAMANSYITMGHSQKAVPWLKQLVQKHPDTDQAKEAEKLLARLDTETSTN